LAEQVGEIPDFEKRLRMLNADDRELVELTLKHRLCQRQIANFLGIKKGTVSRRLRRIINRLHDPLIVAITDPACMLTPDYKQLAIEYFLHQLPMHVIARRHQLTLYDVRTGLEYLRGWFRGVKSTPR
jgi:hypothetical protein